VRALCLNVNNNKILPASAVEMVVIEISVFEGMSEKDKSLQ
jgi:hypothetical protein